MPRSLLVIVALAGLCPPVLAQELPSPAAQGSGHSTQTLGLAHDAAKATVDSEGAFDTQTGAGQGHLSVDLNGLGVGIGFAQPAGDNAGGSGEDSPGPGAAGETGVASGNLGEAGPPSQMQGAEPDLNGSDACIAGGASLPAEAISEIGDGMLVRLIPGCGPGTIGTDQRRAVAGNVALAGLLAANGLTPEAVLFLTMDEGRVTVGYRP